MKALPPAAARRDAAETGRLLRLGVHMTCRLHGQPTLHQDVA